ncbi:cardiolipin synthase [Saccharospirillum alexandrii]|uniref:cardiolipin synthase n=1 Tax=Saccharospirillum alexandrii TaxID=2448477 RepID=UPI000FDA84E0|nr:cardiolipin synthase [Saccharospirillum alexandrii]
MTWDWLLTLGLWLYIALLIALSFRILMRRRSVGVTLAWLLLIYIVPLVGFGLYLLFGERYLGRLRAKRAMVQNRFYNQWLHQVGERDALNTLIDTPLRPVMELTLGSLKLPALRGHNWQLLSEPDSVFDALLDDLNRAENWIFMEFYILEPEGRVEEILTALTDARARGVAVYLLLDSVGCNRFLKSARHRQLVKAGVEVLDVLHANVLRMFLQRIDLRQHRKLVSIDNRIAYNGSMNLADPDWFKKHSGFGPWVDVMVRVEGPMASIIQGTMIFDWEMETGHRLDTALSWPEAASDGPALMQFLPTGPAFDEDILLQVLLTAVHNAQRRVIITTPYFVPDESLLQALKSVAKRGLEVTLLVPRRIDSRLAKYAGRSFYDELLSHGIEILRFEGGLLHTKSVIIDDHLVLVGSVNLDMRSLWLNFEATLVVDDPAFCNAMVAVVAEYKKNSHRLDLKQWRKRRYHKRVVENLAQLASPLL